MTKQEIQALIDAKIAGQGSAVDVGGALPKILTEILNAAFAGANVQSDWDESDNTDPSFIKNKPTIPAAQVQSDWAQGDSEEVDFIKNKPLIAPVADVGVVPWHEKVEITLEEYNRLTECVALLVHYSGTTATRWFPYMGYVDDGLVDILVSTPLDMYAEMCWGFIYEEPGDRTYAIVAVGHDNDKYYIGGVEI